MALLGHLRLISKTLDVLTESATDEWLHFCPPLTPTVLYSRSFIFSYGDVKSLFFYNSGAIFLYSKRSGVHLSRRKVMERSVDLLRSVLYLAVTLETKGGDERNWQPYPR